MTNLDGVFRREWGPAVAALAGWSGDLTVAEDAVQEAFTEALRAWPRDGVPDNPGVWVRRRLPATAPAITCVANPRLPEPGASTISSG
jgi:predicted RNA polymerase sigma factor